ncbi:hypothetical protein M407DRAFT_23648 [Tulasnella calospora MUT 4182]|uniref:OPT superfamily oligopeptide transporter n=1 Tax=Tulasnella calospora MUT 4182 TaxID=1051891 RepID=A0A0C3QKU9_9AGAM|nr:hypothetical protein M407DRAFT_23648 [Tulasnella calospora MUT 4182]
MSSRGRSIAPPSTTPSLSTSPSPVTPPDYLALGDLGTYVRSFTRAAEGAVEIAPTTALTVTPFASALSPTIPNPASPFTSLPRSAVPNTRGRIVPPAITTLFRERNAIVNQLFGSLTGLGMGILCFDWGIISNLYGPLYVPWWSQANVAFGFILSCWVITPALYYSDAWKSAHLPIMSAGAFDRFAQPYNITRVLNPDLTFNAAAYAEYSPLYMTATLSVLYLVAFAVIPALFIHFALQHGPIVLETMLNRRKQAEDIHARLMRQYRSVPIWWYAAIFCLCFAMSIASIKIEDIETPVWILLLALLLAAVAYVPSAFIMALSGQALSLDLMAEIVPGALLPGKPLANMVFKVYTLQTVGMALSYTEALKLGHYLKLPPRTVFAGVQTFYTASIIWGTIGPRRQFGRGGVYNLELYGLAVGVFLPLPCWLLQRHNPISWARFVNVLIVLFGSAYVPSWDCLPYTSSALVGFISQYLVKRQNSQWWAKYNYVLGAALDAGTPFYTLIIAAALGIPKGGKLSPAWWGNSVWTTTADAVSTPYLPTDPREGF